VYGVEGARFALAGELSDEVERTIDPLADAVREEARALLARQLPKSPRQAPSRPPP